MRWRFLVTLLTLALMYLALFHVEEWVTRRLAYAGFGYDDSEDTKLAAEVAEIKCSQKPCPWSS